MPYKKDALQGVKDEELSVVKLTQYLPRQFDSKFIAVLGRLAGKFREAVDPEVVLVVNDYVSLLPVNHHLLGLLKACFFHHLDFDQRTNI